MCLQSPELVKCSHGACACASRFMGGALQSANMLGTGPQPQLPADACTLKRKLESYAQGYYTWHRGFGFWVLGLGLLEEAGDMVSWL